MVEDDVVELESGWMSMEIDCPSTYLTNDSQQRTIFCQVMSDYICDLLQVPCKPVLTCSMFGLSATKPSPPPSSW